MKSTVSVIILTYNDRLHIRRCIERVRPIATEIFVVDCRSTDGTQEIARDLGATVVEHDWPGNQAVQFNWALDNLPLTGDWVLRLDADEYLTPELVAEVSARLDTLPPEVTGVRFKRRHIFLGKWVRHGVYPVWLLRLARRGAFRCEQRKMDEHLRLAEGREVAFVHDFVDHNLNDLLWWSQKHLGYAKREADDLAEAAFDVGSLSGQAAAKRRLKARYAHLPRFWRAFAYFVYRYFLRLGFLDGVPGFLWAFLQAFWYRTLVDALLYEREHFRRP